MKTIAFIAHGAFGRAVAARLAAAGRYEIDVLRPGGGPARLSAASDAVISAGCIPLDVVRSAVGAVAEVPWLPLLLEPFEFSVGPWIGPGSTCVPCYTARRTQHDGSEGRSALVRAALEQSADEDLWPFLPFHARIAAALALRRLDQHFGPDASPSGADPASVLRYRFAKASTSVSTVIPLGGCTDCREPAAARRGSSLETVFTLLAKENRHADN